MKNVQIHKAAENAVSRLGVLFFLLLVGSVVYVGNQLFPYIYYYNELVGLMEAQAYKASVFSDEEIRKTLLKKIEQLEIPIDDPDDLKINRTDGKIIIDLTYDEVLRLELPNGKEYDLYTLTLNPHVEKMY